MSNRWFICDYEDERCGMGIRLFLAALMFVILLSATTWSQSPYVSGVVGPTTTPVSQTQQSLFRSPNWYDTSGNSLIEGNVRGGAYFHGPVPYPSATSFQGPVPSADTLYSFMRYSVGSGDLTRAPGQYGQTVPYYNPSQTVTFTVPNRSGVFTPLNASAAQSASSSTGVGFIRPQPSRQILAGTATAADIGAGPLSMGLQETEGLISAEAGGLVGPGPQFGGSGASTTGVVKPRAGQIIQGAADLRIKPVGTEGIQQGFEVAGQPYAEESVPQEDMAVKRIDRERMLEQVREQMLNNLKEAPATTSSDVNSGEVAGSVDALRRAIGTSVNGTEVAVGAGIRQQELLDTYTKIKNQIDNLQEDIKQLKTDKGAGEAPSAKSVSGYGQATAGSDLTSGLLVAAPSQRGERPDELELEKTASAGKIPERVAKYSGNDPELQEFRKNVERLVSENERKDKLTTAGMATEAERILGGKSIAAFSEDKYNEYMKAGEVYQKQGRYYRAASAYTLASIYKPGDPLAYAGKSYALLAAGEYMSSALHLSRAIEISPEYAKVKVDLLTILGTDDKEQIKNRIADIEQWYKRSDEVELKFLLGYIYYQMGELDKAKETIDTTYTMLPDSPAVNALRDVIEKK